MNKNIIRTYGLAMAAALACAGLWSCSSDEGTATIPTVKEEQTSDMVTVTVGLSGELDKATTRADAERIEGLYAVQVDDADGNSYAYGVFDEAHVDSLKMTLKRNQTYNFRATLVVDGESELYKDSTGVYGAPLNTKKTNSMVYSDTESLGGISDGAASLAADTTGTVYDQPAIDRYYGEVELTATESADLSIDMYRTVYQLVFQVTNVEPFEGTVHVSSLHGHIAPVELTATNKVHDAIYSLTDLPEAVSQKDAADGYYEDDTFVVSWEKADGTTVAIAGGESLAVKKYRNQKTTVSIVLDTSDEGSPITLTEVTSEITDGDTYNVDKHGVSQDSSTTTTGD